jgi:hypothetical protein
MTQLKSSPRRYINKIIKDTVNFLIEINADTFDMFKISLMHFWNMRLAKFKEKNRIILVIQFSKTELMHRCKLNPNT